ncbi:DUF4397 domain-containing protein [Mucilaginibacter sp. UR6-11]|uniref:DUF4397 domain-containing protein n=1 Tax=Mucilaginibacter sp. UR6-11 TaxID=1435644 RepID=UPI001E34F03C|nr:DUF4397 domain-containing protein [Mucilaginibacter sp. UR6-11]MCC8424025.1 DUF4397 domain-containing protein [Mucilaginibacter sp. UR6-11]
MNSRLLLLCLIIAVSGFLSCKKNSDDLPVSYNSTFIGVTNASADTLNVYQNGTRLNIGSTLLPSGQYTNLLVKAGTNNFQFKKAGSPNTLIDTKITLLDTVAYTLFVAGQSADKVFLLRDTVANDSTAKVRFVNASPDAGSLDFSIANGPVYKSRAFKSATPFISVSPGKVVYSIYRQGIAVPLAMGTLTLTKHTSYTLFTKGLVNGTGTALLGARILITSTN